MWLYWYINEKHLASFTNHEIQSCTWQSLKIFAIFHCRGFFQRLPKRGQNKIVWIIEGQVRICVQSMGQARGVQGHANPENFDFGPYKGLNWFTCKIEFSAYRGGASQSQEGQSILKIEFVLAKKGGIAGGGWISPRAAVHIVAALARYRKAMVGTGWAISLLFDPNGHR